MGTISSGGPCGFAKWIVNGRQFGAALLLACLSLFPALGWAEPVTPPPGTELRAALLDAIRPFAIYDLNPPIEFVVLDLRVEGDRAFGQLMAQRPGGAAIDLAQSPLHLRDRAPLDLIDGPRIEVFFLRDAEGWRVINYYIGSTDAWWYTYDCANYGSFFPRYC